MRKTLETIRLPDIISAANGVLGYAACLMVIEGYLRLAAVTVIFAAILDGVDGTVARSIEFSQIGKMLDSFADLISFGVAPALLVYRFHSSDISIAITSAFVICGALRLSRFVVLSTENFTGLPITASGIFISLLFLSGSPPFLTLLIMAVLAALMISDLKYPKIRDIRPLAVLLVSLLLTSVSALLSAEMPVKIFSFLSLLLILLYIFLPLKEVLR